MEKFSEQNVKAHQGKTISYESYDVDDYGVELAPGTRCKVTISQPGFPRVVFYADEHMARGILDFLETTRNA